MTGAPWTSEETAITVVFASRGVRHEAIVYLLSNRSASLLGMPPEANSVALAAPPRRTLSAIRGKLSSLRRHHPTLWHHDGTWNADEVVQFLYRLPSIDPLQVTVLLNSAPTEIAQMMETSQVSSGHPKSADRVLIKVRDNTAPCSIPCLP